MCWVASLPAHMRCQRMARPRAFCPDLVAISQTGSMQQHVFACRQWDTSVLHRLRERDEDFDLPATWGVVAPTHVAYISSLASRAVPSYLCSTSCKHRHCAHH